jgi:molybdenum cofactor cytidylyltransferase
MKLSQALRLSGAASVALVGAGGKTSAMATLAKELQPPLLVTSTTHLGAWQTTFADQHIILKKEDDVNKIENDLSGIMLVTQEPYSNRLSGLSPENMHKIHDLCNKHKLPLLMECDGARQLPIKAPGSAEPVIPEFTDMVVVVAGLCGLGKPLSEQTVYNPDGFSRLGNLPKGKTITGIALARVLSHEQGGLKSIPSRARKILLLNQADTPLVQAQAGTLAKNLISHFDGILIAELQKNKIHALIEPTAAIILAAGSSSRFGQTKQLLEYEGVPFIRSVTSTAIHAGLAPIIVVTGADAEAVGNALSDLTSQISLVYNPNWQGGQSSSIRAGIDALSKLVYQNRKEGFLGLPYGFPGSAIFLLADQPQVTIAILSALMEAHYNSLSPVIAPLVDDRRGNPVLFDGITFPDLQTLQGDVGGRAIFSRYPPAYLPWYDRSILMDVDTPGDYERLLIDRME